MFLFKITKLRWYCMMRKLNQNQWTEQVSQFKGSSSHQMRTNPFSAGNHYNNDLGPLWRSWRSWISCRLWWWGLYHCPGGFQPGKMKAEERWRPAGQKTEPQVIFCVPFCIFWKSKPQVRQNYLGSVFLCFVGNLDVKKIVLILRLRWALGAPWGRAMR